MAWLQKRPQVTLQNNYYTVGKTSTLLIVGLGNPEEKYATTRHNIGFSCLDAFCAKYQEMSIWTEQRDLKCQITKGQIGDQRIIAMKPTTYMNLSGQAVDLVARYYKIQNEHIAVIHDELDIDFGHIRTRYGGSDAGHNGIKSVTAAIGDNYGRVRIGIGPKHPPKIDSADYVLQSFDQQEQEQLTNLKRECVAILSEFIYSQRLNEETRNFIV